MSNGKSILLVDASALSRRKVRIALEAAGWRVLELGSPIGAARTILRHAPEVILLDVPPTEAAVEEIEEVVRASRALRGTSVMLYSVRSEEELAELATRCGVDGYLEKSANDDVLVQAVSRLVGK